MPGIVDDLGLALPTEEAPAPDDALLRCIAEYTHLLDESDPEDPTDSNQEVLPQDQEQHAMPDMMLGDVPDQFSMVKDELIRKAQDRMQNSMEFQAKQRGK